MKKYFYSLQTIFFGVLIMCFNTNIFASDSLYVNGRNLYNHCNEKIILKGVNYAVLDDWNFPANMNNGNERLKEIAKTNANCVRIQWYNNYGDATRPSYNLTHLDSLLARCARLKIVPIVGLWDATCSNDWASFNTNITNWFTQPSVVQLIKKHQRYLIVNPANEMGYYQWTSNATVALATMQQNYKTLITTFRNAGINVPIMIDAPDCGTNADALLSIGQNLINHDSLKNILLSVHTYWYSFTGNTSTAINNKLQAMISANLPFVLGEIANFQADATPCQYNLNYAAVLNFCTSNNLGWLAWSWTNDYCSSREMTNTGLYNQLTIYGADIVNNATYGLASQALKLNNTFAICNTLNSSNNIVIYGLKNGNKSYLKINNNLSENGVLIVQKSNNQNNWISIAQISNKTENNSIPILLDETINDMFYRVIFKAIDGEVVYSNVISILANKNKTITIYPSPAQSNIYISNTNYDLYANIYNAFGKIVFKDIKLKNGDNKIDITMLPKGIYFLKIMSNINSANNYSFIKQ